MAGVGWRVVLAAGDIADVVQLVLDAPMRARQGEKTFRPRRISGQAGDGVHRLHGGFAAHDAFAGETADLGQTALGWRQMLGQRGRDFQPASLDPAMAFLDGFRMPQVRWRRPCRRGGNPARRPRQRRLSAPAGCL